MKFLRAHTAATVEASFVTIEVMLLVPWVELRIEQSPIAVIMSEFGLLTGDVEVWAEA
jgi:hypothetical protein